MEFLYYFIQILKESHGDYTGIRQKYQNAFKKTALFYIVFLVPAHTF